MALPLTPDEFDRCAKAFERQKDTNGSLSHWQIRNVLQELGQDTSDDCLQHMFALIDPDQTGAIVFDDFITMMVLNKSKTRTPLGPEFVTREIWRSLGGSLDKSGCVDVRDFAKAVSNYGVHTEVFEDLIQQYCQSPSEMTFSEFDAAFRKMLLVGGDSPMPTEGFFSNKLVFKNGADKRKKHRRQQLASPAHKDFRRRDEEQPNSADTQDAFQAQLATLKDRKASAPASEESGSQVHEVSPAAVNTTWTVILERYKQRQEKERLAFVQIGNRKPKPVQSKYMDFLKMPEELNESRSSNPGPDSYTLPTCSPAGAQVPASRLPGLPKAHRPVRGAAGASRRSRRSPAQAVRSRTQFSGSLRSSQMAYNEGLGAWPADTMSDLHEASAQETSLSDVHVHLGTERQSQTATEAGSPIRHRSPTVDHATRLPKSVGSMDKARDKRYRLYGESPALGPGLKATFYNVQHRAATSFPYLHLDPNVWPDTHSPTSPTSPSPSYTYASQANPGLSSAALNTSMQALPQLRQHSKERHPQGIITLFDVLRSSEASS
mmetsp:Transcript_149071/g.260504  ORF Transcript_149071/g.260504 Transcript_149071/m.260504 type:complete len:548 (-) Transcript_149071:292-1935(-)